MSVFTATGSFCLESALSRLPSLRNALSSLALFSVQNEKRKSNSLRKGRSNAQSGGCGNRHRCDCHRFHHPDARDLRRTQHRSIEYLLMSALQIGAVVVPVFIGTDLLLHLIRMVISGRSGNLGLGIKQFGFAVIADAILAALALAAAWSVLEWRG
ncbi:MAG TPA: hypothetical protein VJ853_05270 [Thermoanaerobaculia bacterium]|nr:hypothetical protein [Thermoanaerobaculia bacterium]